MLRRNRFNPRPKPLPNGVAGEMFAADNKWCGIDPIDTIQRRALNSEAQEAGMIGSLRRRIAITLRLGCSLALLLLLPGCAWLGRREAPPPPPPARVFVVAPVLNLSGATDVDALRLTDLLASECVSFPGVTVIPVNLTLAELLRQGKEYVETPEDAVALAQVFGADATLVFAVTEYDPYDPPIVGLVLQYYPAQSASRPLTGFDPLTASRAVAEPEVALSVAAPPTPRWQIQRVFDASQETLLANLRSYAEQRDGQRSPYGWQKYMKSQELFVRYCGWSLIRTMLTLDEVTGQTASHEARS